MKPKSPALVHQQPSAPTAENQLNSLARDASKAWSHHNKGYSSATKPLWKIIKEACRMAYEAGYDTAAAKAREELEYWKEQVPMPTKTTDDYLANAHQPLDSARDKQPSADVEEVTGITTGAIQRTLDQTFNESARESVKTIIREALVQDNALLVVALERIKARVPLPSPYYEMVQAALTGIGEKETLAGKTGNNNKGKEVSANAR